MQGWVLGFIVGFIASLISVGLFGCIAVALFHKWEEKHNERYHKQLKVYGSGSAMKHLSGSGMIYQNPNKVEEREREREREKEREREREKEQEKERERDVEIEIDVEAPETIDA